MHIANSLTPMLSEYICMWPFLNAYRGGGGGGGGAEQRAGQRTFEKIEYVTKSDPSLHHFSGNFLKN